MRDWYAIRAKAANHAELLIYGDIGESWWSDESVTAKKLVAQLQGITASAITVRLNSYGGSVADGLAIFNALQRHPAAITTSNDGVAMSIASLIFMAGTSRQAAANSLLMLHAPWGAAVGNAKDMRDMADVLDRYAEAMISAYQGSGLSDGAIRELLTDGQDHFYTAAEALASGFATEVGEALAVAASYRDNRYTARRAPPPKTQDPSTPEGKSMAEHGNTPGAAPNAPPPAAPPTLVDVASIETAAEARERERIKARAVEIRTMFKPFAARREITELQDAMLDDPTIPLETVSSRLLTMLGEHCEPLGSSPRISMGQTAGEKFGVAAAAAIRARCGLEPRDAHNEFNGRKLIELAVNALELQGIRCAGASQLEIAQRALVRSETSRQRIRAAGSQTTSDFDVVLENVMHKTLLQAWGNTPDTWSRLCKTGSVGDLRAWLRLQPGSIGDIDVVNEAGEYRNKTIPDAVKESIQAKRRGNIIAVTPEVLINDDLSYFSDVPAMFGRAARRSIETAFYALLTSNSGAGPTMNETAAALFSTAHGNLTTAGAAPGVTTIDAARQILATQKDPSGNEFLGITPAIWLGPMALGSTARVVNNSTYDPDAANKLQRANPVYNLFRDIIDTPRLSGTAWYVFADPSVMPVFEVVFLDGQNEPMLSQETEFRTSGLAWKIELPFGVGAIGWRGAYQNDGA